MDRLACIDLPAFPLQILMRRHPDWVGHPVAVVDKDKPQGVLLWVNEEARKYRILPGMRYAAGLSLCKELRAGMVADAEIEAGAERVKRRLRFYTPEVEPSESDPGLFWLGATGLSLLHPSLVRWALLIQTDLARNRFAAEVAVGFSRFGTYAAAKCGAALRNGKPTTEATNALPITVFRERKDEVETVREIPIDRLTFENELRDTLAKLGVHTLGGFIDLPPEGLQKRFGPDVFRLHQLARGEIWNPIEPEAARHRFGARHLFQDPEPDRGRLLARTEEMLHGVLKALEQKQRELTELTLRLTFEHDGTGSRTIEGEKKELARSTERLTPAKPTLDGRQLIELLRLRMDRLTIPAGVTEVVMTVESISIHQEQLQLFREKPRRDLDAVARAFAQLRAEFGDDAVVKAVLHDGHLPEAKFQWERAESIDVPKARRVKNRPLIRRILEKAMPLPSRPRHEPDGWLISGVEGGAVEEIFGPYLVSGGWWRRSVHREYHYVHTDKGRWIWVYYDRERRRWFQHGEVE